MSAELQARIDRVHRGIQGVVRNLHALGYQFSRPRDVLPGPEPGTDAAVKFLEQAVGPLPRAITLFWSRVGSVDLGGHHPTWSGCNFPDPLIVYPPSVAIAELEEHASDREERDRCGLSYCIPIAPDALHKADVSGGKWYNISVPSVVDDPPLNDEPHATTFLDYLDIALGQGGFPGLAAATAHNWPVEVIISAPRPPPSSA